MKFAPRNAYYLRISANAVLPLYVYLDEQHREWMSERVLQHVLSDLRPLILPKLLAEENASFGLHSSGSAKKGTLDVHRGDTYQFGYFLRNTEPHAVLVKTRWFTASPAIQKVKQSSERASAPQPETPATSSRRKRTARSKGKAPANKRGKAALKSARHIDNTESEEEAIDISDDDGPGETVRSIAVDPSSGPLRRSTRKKGVKVGTYAEDDDAEADISEIPALESHSPLKNTLAADPAVIKAEQVDVPLSDEVPTENTEMTEPPPSEPQPDSLAVEDEEEPKPKPIMSLRYQGFSIHGRCLCVIVEPYPPIRQQRQMSLNPDGLRAPRAPSIAPADFVVSGSATQRAQTPLFLPDFDDERRSVTPAPVSQRVRPPVPLFDEEAQEEDEDDGGMYAFSQILQSVGEHHTGAVDDDDEMEGMVLFGDADEAREL